MILLQNLTCTEIEKQHEDIQMIPNLSGKEVRNFYESDCVKTFNFKRLEGEFFTRSFDLFYWINLSQMNTVKRRKLLL